MAFRPPAVSLALVLHFLQRLLCPVQRARSFNGPILLLRVTITPNPSLYNLRFYQSRSFQWFHEDPSSGDLQLKILCGSCRHREYRLHRLSSNRRNWHRVDEEALRHYRSQGTIGGPAAHKRRSKLIKLQILLIKK